MITIKEEELESLLKSKKKYIEIKKFSGIGDIVSGISFGITLLTTKFEDIAIIGSIYFKIAMFCIAILILCMGIYNLFNSVRSTQTIPNLYESIIELDAGKVHIVNIVLLKNAPKEGKYLLIKNKAWKCTLFPSYNTYEKTYEINKQLKSVLLSFSRDIGIRSEHMQMKYLGSMSEHSKICYGKKIKYRYLFHFYNVELLTTDVRVNKKFHYNGNKYVWMSLDEMLGNKNIMKKNKDVVDYVAELENIPYN